MTKDNSSLPQRPLISFNEALLRELRKQVVAPASLIRLRLHMYYYFPWIGLRYQLDTAIIRRVVKATPKRTHGPWLFLPTKEAEALQILDRKVELYLAWKEDADKKAGRHGEDLVAMALKEAGFEGIKTREPVQHNDQWLEMDVLASDPLPLAITVKNKLSDVYHHPKVGPYGEDMSDITKHFIIAHSLGMVPVLVASLVDRSFYSFQKPYKGLHQAMRFQYLPAEYEALCNKIREQTPLGFWFGNVKATNDPPQRMVDWFKAVPERYMSSYGVKG